MKRSSAVKTVLWIFTGMAVVVAISRFTRGLGATTNLTDSAPWGFWIGFDVMAGVALAAGGFVMAAAVYIFRLEKYRPLLRATVLTAFLGYLAVAIGLLFDLGVPWHIYYPALPWNMQYHSVLFEVAMCVMAYLTVLALEFAPVALEHKFFQWGPFPRIYHLLKTLTVPLVILGIMLSTLHQSSLGSLFIIMPHRTHPLWYSPMLLPLNFFVSAIGLGMMMVVLENYVSGWIYHHKPRTDLLSGVAKVASIVLGLYAVIRLFDLFNRSVLPTALDGSWQSVLFVAELAISAAVPAVLLSIKKVRENSRALFALAAMVVFGMVMYRLDIAIITQKRWPGTSYIPSLMEFMVSIGIVSGLGLVFMFFVEHLKVFEGAHEEDREQEPELETADQVLAGAKGEPPRGLMPGTVTNALASWFHEFSPFEKAEFSPIERVWIGDPFKAAVRKYSMVAVIAIAFTLAVLPAQAIFGFAYNADPVDSARLMEDARTLKIDGNHAAELVYFDHEEHKELTGGIDGCVKCHHMALPGALASDCASCHSDMYKETSAFDHEEHQRHFNGNDGCVECHPLDKNPKNAKSCVACHQEMWPDKSENEKIDFMAPSYVDALHGKCITCHEEEAAKLNRPDLPLCTTCHTSMSD